MFREVPLSIIGRFLLYTQQWYMSYRFADSLREGSGWNCFRPYPARKQWYMSYRFANSLRAGSGLNWFRSDPARKLLANLYNICHCCVYSAKTPDDEQRNRPKHVEFYSKTKFEKLVHLVGFIVRILHYVWITHKTIQNSPTHPIHTHTHTHTHTKSVIR